HAPSPSHISTLSLHDALPISAEAGKRLCLVEVRGNNGGERKEPADERVDGVVLQQPRSRARDHHGIDDERDGVPSEVLRHRLDQDRKSTRLNSSHVAISYAVF